MEMSSQQQILKIKSGAESWYQKHEQIGFLLYLFFDQKVDVTDLKSGLCPF